VHVWRESREIFKPRFWKTYYMLDVELLYTFETSYDDDDDILCLSGQGDTRKKKTAEDFLLVLILNNKNLC